MATKYPGAAVLWQQGYPEHRIHVGSKTSPLFFLCGEGWCDKLTPIGVLIYSTLPRFNMEPKIDGVQKESPIPGCHFQVNHVKLWEGNPPWKESAWDLKIYFKCILGKGPKHRRKKPGSWKFQPLRFVNFHHLETLKKTSENSQLPQKNATNSWGISRFPANFHIRQFIHLHLSSGGSTG